MKNTVVVSDKFEITIPQSIRNSLKIKPGHKFRVINLGCGCLALVPIVRAAQFRGFLKGIDTTVEREPDREF